MAIYIKLIKDTVKIKRLNLLSTLIC